MNKHDYTKSQIAWLKKYRPLLQRHDLTDKFNAKFSTNLSFKAVEGTCKRHGFKCGSDGRYSAGQNSWNTGTKGLTNRNKTTFVTGHTPKNTKAIGYERIVKDGYVEIKVGEGAFQFKAKHRVVYEAQFGELAPDQVIIFLDGNRQNTDIDNLVAITRSELVTLNRHEKFGIQPPEIKRTLITLIRLEKTLKQDAAA